MKSNILIVCICAAFLAACTGNTKKQEKELPSDTAMETSEPHETSMQQNEPPPPNFNYATVVNERYNFSFEVPEMWSTKDKSSSGDGFYIETGEAGVDCRVYGSTLTGIEDIDNAGMHCEAVGQFVFNDGTKGTKCTDDGSLYFFYKQGKKQTTFYVKAPDEWKKKNIAIINHIAASITMSRPS